ncbi:hypothetical protein MPH_01628 [Macrophomina phaseolina MS6]|uniref:F-box domain-containing protein n=1 Tax=Macrophomina phaseolina (strain MS6) TaxID=1126212 RepID=K2REZ7_MACPH|nr:hypothetical protein MPH_01628 [Macrophomina phaseolina MS6]
MARVIDPSLIALPTELLLLIIKYLEPASIINFAFAAYPALQSKMIVPPMTWRVYAPLCRDLELPTSQRGPLAIFGAWPLPTELTLQVLSGLGPEDLMRFVFGHYHLVPRLLPEITPATKKQLTKAWLQVEMVRKMARDQRLSWTASLNRRNRSWSV